MEKRIFRNIQHEPRIWGLSFEKLFGSLLLSLLVLMGIHAGGGGGLAMVLGGIGTAFSAYSLSFYLDNRDPMRSDQAKFIRPAAVSIEQSNQRILIRKD